MATTPLNLADANAPLLTPEQRQAILAQQQQQQAIAAAPAPAIPGASLLAATPSQQQLARTPDFNTQQAQALQADTPNVTQKPGPVKKFLTDFLGGFGDSARAHVGLETNAQRQTREFNQSIAQQNAKDLSGQRQANTDLTQSKLAQLDFLQSPYTVAPDDESVLPQFRGTNTTKSGYQALQAISAKAAGAQGIADTKAQSALDLETLKQNGGNPRDHQITSIGGRRVIVSKRDGSVLKDLGIDTAMLTPEVRARANAQYGVANVMDGIGDPTAISRLQQLQTGAPSMTEKATQNLAGDKVGVATYLGASKVVEDNLHVLRDPAQRAIIARATDAYEKDPGALSAILNSSLQSGLSPEGAKLIGGLKQMTEFGATFKRYTGNGGAATDSLRSTIHANQASAQNSEATNRQLIMQDRALAAQVANILGKPGRYTAPARGGSNAPTPSTPAPAAAETRNYQGHNYTKGADGQWHLQP